MTSSRQCKYFLEGTCKYGDKCLFSHETLESRQFTSPPGNDHEPEVSLAPEVDAHESEASAVPTNQPENTLLMASSSPASSASAPIFEPCTYHVTGRCDRGDFCVVTHCEPVGPVYSPIPSVSPSIAELKVGADWTQFSEQAVARAFARDIPPCAFFAGGLCNKADRCRFRHDLVHDSGSQPPANPQRLRPCKYFADGSCAKGVVCPFAHDLRVADASAFAADEPSQTRPCRYYSQGKCRMGRNCHFRHVSSGNDSVPIPSQIPGPSESSEEQAPSWILDTDNNPAWGVDEQDMSQWVEEAPPSKLTEEATGSRLDWFQDTDENTNWKVDQKDGLKWTPSAAVEEDSGTGWLERTDENPSWNVDGQHASKWVSDTPPRPAESIPSPLVKDLGAEQSWDIPWPDPVPDVKPRVKAYCKCFGQGHCYNGDSCQFLHVGESGNRWIESSGSQEPEDVPPQSIYRCKVRFGSGAIPEHVVTPFESYGVILMNYPPGMAHDDIVELANPYGVVKNTTFRLISQGVQAHIEFEDSVQAADAALKLNGVVIDELVMHTQLDSACSVSASAHGLDAQRQIKLVWDAPSVSGWAFYPNVSLAKAEGVRLDGIMYGDRRISAEYRKASQPHSIPVYISGLPPQVNRQDLHTFCAGSSSVSLNAPKYVRSPDENIRACLARFGPINHFEVLPTDPSQLKITAIATFTSATAAADAIRALKGTPHHFLGKGCIAAQPVFHSKYHCTQCPFHVIHEDLAHLRDSCADSACTVRFYDQPPCIHVFGRRAQAVAPVKKSIEALLFGSKLEHWDPYFETASSEEALRRINTGASFYIQRDIRHRVLRIWGKRGEGEKQIIRLLKRVQAKRHNLPLDPSSLAIVLNGFQSLQDAFGGPKLLLNLRSRTLTVLGDIKPEVESHIEGLITEYSRGTGKCCLCFSAHASEHVELDCAHIYCLGCTQLLLRPVPGVEFATPRCVAEIGPDNSQCLEPIPTHLIVAHLSEAEQKQLFESALLSWVRSDPDSDLRFCVSGCTVLFRRGIPDTVFTCPECALDLCASCAVPAHAGLTCAEYQEYT
ncbi:hypothetical protein B0H15DRAFT_805060 [Mycena belliarum]|uniref:C3H1-type domain-containing protein n=1 Tax=Mycena belliarum TaxID=1033014 RepID=A0AAD6TSA5_9AGAR|nr:hypothetical protein B0H15DRAFT_805060 [Mycena belliae]